MPSSPQTVATRVVFDYLLDDGGNPIVGARVIALLNTNQASVTSPVVNVLATQKQTTTDSNGYWQFTLIPNDILTPSGTLYSIMAPGSTYDISVPSGAGSVQSSSILANTPSVLSPAVTGLTGPITVTGNETVTGNLTVNGTTTLGGTTTGALTTAAESVGGDLTIQSAFRLLMLAAASKLVPGATSFSVRNNADSQDNLLVSNAGNVTMLGSATVTGGPLTVSANGLTVTAGGATISAGDAVITAGRLVLNAAVAKIKGGATSLSLRNNADSADNILITDAGVVTYRGQVNTTGGEVLTQNASTNVPISINGASNLPAQVNLKIQSGRFAWSVAGANSQSGTLTFPVAFTAGCNPVVILTVEVGANDDFNANLTAQPGNTSFLWRLFQNTGVNVTVSGNVHWLAIGF